MLMYIFYKKLIHFNIFLVTIQILVSSSSFCYNCRENRTGRHWFNSCRRMEETMFRLWAKIFRDNRMLQDTVICDASEDTRTHKVFRALDEVCSQFDLGKPIWLDANISDFKRHRKTRFLQDSFVEQVDFDYLEIQIIEED